MPSNKRTTDSKRTSLPLASAFAKPFKKDWERLSRSGRYDMNRLKEAMLLLIANDGPLGPEWLDHALKGDWADHRECHIGGDFLLIYQVEGGDINFVRAGTHAELFD
jgi:mRNA interferase YafQ